MSYFSYKIEHDFGLAPNPFGEYCTIAVCKSDIRKNKNLKLGDWIIGTGSAKLKKLHRLIFAMRVEEKITFNDYWNDSRFHYKRPIINGSLVQLYGDNIYHQDAETEEWIQENSAHSLISGLLNADHTKRDIGGKYVLISREFYYFGDKAPEIPTEFIKVCSEGRNVKGPAIPIETANRFINWLAENYNLGIHGDPINWKDHK